MHTSNPVLHNGLTIFPEQDEAIDQVLNQLVSGVPADFALLTDSSGQVISFDGDRAQIDLVSLGALVAGEQIASQEMARLAGEYQACQMLIREGTNSNFYICDAGRYLVLLVKASNDIPLGWARMLIRQSGTELAKILAPGIEGKKDKPDEITQSPDDNVDLLSSFGSSVQELEHLIDNAINQFGEC